MIDGHDGFLRPTCIHTLCAVYLYLGQIGSTDTPRCATPCTPTPSSWRQRWAAWLNLSLLEAVVLVSERGSSFFTLFFPSNSPEDHS